MVIQQRQSKSGVWGAIETIAGAEAIGLWRLLKGKLTVRAP